MYKISKEFHFSAGHHVEGLPKDHPCTNPHGHNYVVIVELESKTLNEVGFVRDYRDLEHIKKFIDTALDHKYLNDFLPVNPTAENIAKHLFDIFIDSTPQMKRITVKETPKTAATYEPR